MYVGKPLRRREDHKFLRGKGTYVDDIKVANCAHMAFVRSPHAHARIRRIDTGIAAAMPGVLRVLTAHDWEAAKLGQLTCVHPMPFSDGRPMNEKLRPALARDKVCHVGDVVAAVVADSKDLALDAAEAVAVDYEALPGVTDIAKALDAGAPVIHPDLGTNLVFEVTRGSRESVAEAFARAHHMTALTLDSNRVAGSPMEPRAYLSVPRPETGEVTLYATSQAPHYFRRWLAKYTLFIPEHKIRVVSPDVGGGFGLKTHYSVEMPTVVWASLLLGRPVRWTSTRSELLREGGTTRS